MRARIAMGPALLAWSVWLLAVAGCPTYTDVIGPDPADDDATGDDDDDDATADDDDATADDDDDDATGDDDDATGDDDDDATGDDDDSAPVQIGAMIATTDFATSGTLADVDLDTHAVTPDVADATTDAWVVYGEDLLVVLDGFGLDSAAAWDLDAMASPLWSAALTAGANPRAGALLDGKLYVVQYGLPAVAILDPADGSSLGDIDLSAFADADGNPECATAAVLDGHLWVSCHRLDATWQPAPEGGLLLKIDPMNDQVVDSWSTSSALTCRAFPGRVDLICHEGVDVDIQWANLYEGAIFAFDPGSGSFGPDVLLEADLSANLGVFAFGPTGGGLVAAAGDTGTALLCVDLGGGTAVQVEADLGWINAMDANDRGEAYVLNRASWSSPYAGPFGASVYDLATCAQLSTGILDLGQEPYTIVFYE